MGQSEDATFPPLEDVNNSEDQFLDYGGDGGGDDGEGQGQEGRDFEQNSGRADQETSATPESFGGTIEAGSSAQSYDDAPESSSSVPDALMPGEGETLESTASSAPNANSTVSRVNTNVSAATGTENVTLDAIHEVTTDSPGITLHPPFATTEKLSRSVDKLAAIATASVSQDLKPPKLPGLLSSGYLKGGETGVGVDMSTNSAPNDAMREVGDDDEPDAVIGRNEEKEDGIEKSIDGRLVSTDSTAEATTTAPPPPDSEVSDATERSGDAGSPPPPPCATEPKEEEERKARLVLATSKSDLDLRDEIKIEKSGGGDVLLTTSAKPQINSQRARDDDDDDAGRLFELLMWPKVVAVLAAVAAISGGAAALALRYMLPGIGRDEVKPRFTSFADASSSFAAKPKPIFSPNSILLFCKTRKLHRVRRGRGQKATTPTAIACAGSGFAILKTTGICGDDDGTSSDAATECPRELPTTTGRRGEEMSGAEGEHFSKHCPVDAYCNRGGEERREEEVCCTGMGEEKRQQHEAAMPLLGTSPLSTCDSSNLISNHAMTNL